MAAAIHPQGFGQPASRRQRVASLSLAMAVTALLLMMLFTLAPSPTKAPPKRTPATFTLLPDTVVADKDDSRAQTERPRTRAAARPRPRPVLRTPTPPRAEVTSPVPPSPLNMILMDRKSFAATDIARMPSAPADDSRGSADAGNDRIGDSQLANGKGPGGEPLYNAEWYRRPSSGDLAGYGYSKGPGVGFGEIACRTAPNYRVVDCVEMAQTPGSGLAGIVRDASPRLRVRPPRIGGRPLVGSWVLIRIDYLDGKPG